MGTRIEKIITKFPTLCNNTIHLCENVYIADYTEGDKGTENNRNVAISGEKPKDIDSFCMYNPNRIAIDAIKFECDSFKDTDGKCLSQCECIVLADCNDGKEWVSFIEMKYCYPKNKRGNIIKARKQLEKTLLLFVESGILDNTQNKYLFYSLPTVSPFAHFSDRTLITRLKSQYNAILRGVNDVKIVDRYKIDS